MRILVTGGAGFIGSHLVRLLLGAGHHVAIVDSLRPSYGGALSSERLAGLRSIGVADIVVGDLVVPSTMDAAADLGPFDRLVHLAAWTGIRAGERHPAEVRRSNIDALESVLTLAPGLGVERLVFASSSSVYGDMGMERACAEKDADGSGLRSAYAESKWAGEELVASFATDTGIPAVAARLFSVIGPWGRPDMAYARFARAMLAGERVEVFGDVRSVRDYTAVGDVVWALAGLLSAPALAPGECLRVNVGFGQPRSLQVLIDAVAAATGVDRPRTRVVARPGADALGTHADGTLLRDVLGAHAPMALNEMVNLALLEPAWVGS